MDKTGRRWLKQKLLVEPFESRDGTGEINYGDCVELSCLINSDSRIVRDARGQEVTSVGAIYLDGEGPLEEAEVVATITVHDRVTLPDGTHPPLLSVEKYNDPNTGKLHSVVLRI